MSSSIILRRVATSRLTTRMVKTREMSNTLLLAGCVNIEAERTSHPSMRQLRSKHGGKRGQHLQNLDEIGNRQEKELAQERRKKKKDKKAAREGKGGGLDSSNPTTKDDNSIVDNDLDEEEGDDELDDENLLPDPKQIKIRLTKHVDSFQQYLRGVRGSEPSPELFDDITVMDAYGKGTGSTSIQSVAQVVISSPTLAVATCYDPATSKAVAEAIQRKLELNPQKEEGGVIKIPLPRPSMESRQQAVRQLHQTAEKYRVRVRKSRTHSLKIVKKGIAGSLEGVSKDDAFRVQKEVESIVDDVMGKLNQLASDKENSIMTV